MLERGRIVGYSLLVSALTDTIQRLNVLLEADPELRRNCIVGSCRVVTTGAKTQAWTLGVSRIQKGRCVRQAQGSESTDCEVRMSQDLFLAVLEGRTNPQAAFARGEIEVEG